MAHEQARVDLWRGRALVLVRLGRVGMHAHSVGALLIGVDGPFCVRLHPAQPWAEVGETYLGAGLGHELDCGDTMMGVLYLSPGPGDDHRLRRRWELSSEPLPQLARIHAVADLRSRYQALVSGLLSGAELSAGVDTCLGGPELITTSDDPRVDAVLQRILANPRAPLRVAEQARALSLSPSRLRNLIRARTGVSLQALRRWQRMREVSRQVGAGASLTRAAHELGFTDSAQLSRDFRFTFGLPPSRVFGRGCAVVVHEVADR